MFLPLCAGAADVYRWVDERGTVHYANGTPPAGVRADKVDVDAEPRAPVAESSECYTARCQGERLEQRLALRGRRRASTSASTWPSSAA